MTSRKKSSILCPNCRKLISTDELRCPYCGISKPGSWWKNNLLTQGVSSADQIIKAIIYANIGMYIISLLFNSRLPGLSFNPFYILSPENRSLLFLGATGTVPVNNVHGWWTLVSANYLHGGILHILFNMFAFRQIALLVSREYGVYRMFIIYALSGIIGFRISYLAGVTFTIGASAAICGLIGAALYYGKSRGGAYGQAIYRQIGGWALGIMLFGFVVPGINNWGHGGGIFAGAILGFFMGYNERTKEGLLHKILAGTCAIITVIVLCWAIGSGFFYRFTV
ncbi:MAG: rhomboid family intramembrane serine protease [Desulfobacteraceae bacterium]|nr:rhomboid family intramembrane serine protease [Pseudomonadota bacterium]MCG2757851.1 rhomboid family intramembrane serine protease [Desulfobacteraceae bacterium]